MRKKRDLTGQKFGKLTARYILPKSEWLRERTTWFCTCECGGTTKVVAGDFAKGSKTNCGCMSTTVKKVLDGKRFGMLTVLHEVTKEERTQKNRVTWECLCDCGSTTMATSSSLVKGTKTSCGCDTIAYNDLTGKKFNMLTVISKTENKSHNRQILWLCECECGTKLEVRADQLNGGTRYSCGCVRQTSIPDITGTKFGKLTALRELPKEERLWDKVHRTWLCQCDCGGATRVTGNDLRGGRITSCGCGQHADLTGQKFGKLTVVKELPKELWLGRNKEQVTWLCNCDCGNEKVTSSSSLLGSGTTSCGCNISIREDLMGRRFGRLLVTAEIPRVQGSRAPVTWVCLCDCGNYCNVASTSNLKRGGVTSCGCAKESMGEFIIRCYLEENKIPYGSEVKFKGLYYKSAKKPLRFDFAILDPDGSTKLLIEYDGEQHFVAKDFFGGEKGLKRTQARDTLKNNYCLENNIPLIRIPYTNYNDIEEILDKALKDYAL